MKPETLEELFDQIQIDADNGVIYNKAMYLKEAKRIVKKLSRSPKNGTRK